MLPKWGITDTAGIPQQAFLNSVVGVVKTAALGLLLDGNVLLDEGLELGLLT